MLTAQELSLVLSFALVILIADYVDDLMEDA